MEKYFVKSVGSLKIEKRVGHGKLRNDHGKAIENILSSLWDP